MRSGLTIRSLFLTALALLTIACDSDRTATGDDQSPPPYQGATELAFGEYHTFGDGHRVTVHAVEHRVRGMAGDEETTGLGAEVEICAGETPSESSYWRLFLFQEAPFDMQGTMSVMHSSGPPTNRGLKEPTLEEGVLQPGECARGWVDYVNVYGDHGKPTKLGFLDESEQDTQAIWPAAEE